MASDPPPLSIAQQKEAYLNSQIRLISVPLAPSRQWTKQNSRSDDPLPAASVERAMQQLNLTMRRHNQLGYSSQATHHVATQVEKLYWEKAAPPEAIGSEDEVRGLRIPKTADLSDEGWLEQLPEAWPWQSDGTGEEEGAEREEDVQRYAALRERLAELHHKVANERSKGERYREILRLLEGFRDPAENVQPNLITKDCEVAKEVDKTRVLMARAAIKLAEMKKAMPEIPDRRDATVELPTDRDRRFMEAIKADQRIGG